MKFNQNIKTYLASQDRNRQGIAKLDTNKAGDIKFFTIFFIYMVRFQMA